MRWQFYLILICISLLEQFVLCSEVCQHGGVDDVAASQKHAALLQSKRETLRQANATHPSVGDTLHQIHPGGLQRHTDMNGVLVVVPGLGSEERAVTVERNIQWLKTQNVPFECQIYVYLSEAELPLDAARFEPCQILRHAGRWLSHIKAVPLQMTRKQYVVHMEDGTEPQRDVNLNMILHIMAANGLGWAAPTFDTAKTRNEYIDEQYPVLARQAQKRIGRFVDFIELHFDVFTRDYFACLQSNIDSSDEDMLHGWGMDRLLPALCGGSVSKPEVGVGRLGLLDQMTMIKRHSGSYDHDAAQRGMDIFISKHPNAPGPTFSTLGELLPPS